MVADPAYANTNTISAIALSMRSNGVLSPFDGIGAMLMKQLPYTSTKQVSFDLIAKALYSLMSRTADSNVIASKYAWVISFASAFLTSIVSCLASQPGDMVLTTICQQQHLQKDQQEQEEEKPYAIDTRGNINNHLAHQSHHHHASAVAAMREIYAKRGIGGFFIGTQARLLHISTIVTTQLIMYDIIKKALGLKATGSH
jgi:solute carrier family 25 phosphate transporter 3